jgi:hypothetical protein
MGYHIVKTIGYIAESLNREDAPALRAYLDVLPQPKKIHDKKADIHTFTFAELEHVALAMIDEARRTRADPHDAVYPGSVAATRFQAGLILMLGWRNPMRARNWGAKRSRGLTSNESTVDGSGALKAKNSR